MPLYVRIGVCQCQSGTGKETLPRARETAYSALPSPAGLRRVRAVPQRLDVNRLRRSGSQYVTRPTIFDYIETREAFLGRLAAVLGWVSSGRLRLKRDHVYPLERAAEGQIALAGRQTTGKVLLVP
jgi:NADPH:quinone reductase-like Zn-dependent oxidoreductase